MTIIERYRAFVSKKRNWKWVAAGLAFVLLFYLLEGVAVLSGLQRLTSSIATSLNAVQPFAITDAFMQATHGHRGLWFCPPVGSLENGCPSVIGFANIGIASLFAVPRVGAEVWRNGGVLSTAFFCLTMLAMAMTIIAGWRNFDKPGNGLGTALMGTIFTLALGPLAAGIVFWLLLHFLLLLTAILGAVLAGITWCIATFGAIYKLGMLLFDGVKVGDELEENAALLGGTKSPPET